MTIRPVILSGGAGTRLWPLSRELYPKQMHRLYGERTLLQETALRVTEARFLAPIIVCNEQHRFIVAEQLREIGVEPHSIIVEPVGRNTAPAVTVAALLADLDDQLLVMPSDHIVRDATAFLAAIHAAAPLAAAGHLVAFGIPPTGPMTGYGYIHRGTAVGGGYHIAGFVEKPDRATAESYLAFGEYDWNAGIFLMQARLYLDEVGQLAPAILEGSREALRKGRSDLFFFRLDTEAFSAIKGNSIDYAVMEKTARAAVVPVDMGWSDIGSWPSLWAESDRDPAGNVIQGDVHVLDSSGSYLRGDDIMVAAVGVKDAIVVASPDVVLVADKSRGDDVKLLVQKLKAAGRPEATDPRRIYRPWGWFETLAVGPGFRVKHLQVNSGGKLSLQKHAHRSEHWVVIRGTASVVCGDRAFQLQVNQSTFIPAGVLHRLENTAAEPLEIVEVQSGHYVGEDDIVRVDDVYGR